MVALTLLHQELAGTHLQAVRLSLTQVNISNVVLSALFAMGSYMALTGYDLLALRHLGKPLPYTRIASRSFIANAVGHNVGVAMISGAAVRLRYYTAEGLSATEVAAMAAMIGATFGIGVGFVAGMAMLLEASEAGALLHLSATQARLLGGVLLTLTAGYLMLNVLRREPVRIGKWQLRLPGAKVTLAQLLLAILDLSCAAGALFWLLPADASLSFHVFLTAYVLAMVAGTASHVPAGLGVFETVLVLALPALPRDGLLAAILGYRAIYYLAPLIIATVLAIWIQAHDQRGRLARGLSTARGLFAWLAPTTVSASVFLTGAILMFSGSTPALSERLSRLHGFVPLPLLEVSHLTGSLVGFALVVLARALYRRVDAAYHLAFWLLTLGAAASLIKGLDYEEATLSALTLGVLWLGRAAFNRPASVLAQSFSTGWMVTVLMVVIATLWLGLFSYKHIDYSNELWWHFAFRADAPRFLRTTLLLALAVTGLGLIRLLRPAPLESAKPSRDDLASVADIVATSADAVSALALLGDKRLLFAPSNDAFVMYQVRGNSWISMGDPVGPDSAHEALAWRFRELADRHGGRVVFYQVPARSLPR